MFTGITRKIQNYLWEASELITLIDWSYVTNTENENLVEIIKHLYPEQPERAKLLNPWSYIGSIILEHYSNYFWVPKVNDNIRADFIDFIETILVTWEARLLINPDNKTLTWIKSNSYYKDWNKEFFIKIYKKPKKENLFWETDDYFLLVETFEKWKFERKLFKLKSTPTIN